jgi:hypothetical protein
MSNTQQRRKNAEAEEEYPTLNKEGRMLKRRKNIQHSTKKEE